MRYDTLLATHEIMGVHASLHPFSLYRVSKITELQKNVIQSILQSDQSFRRFLSLNVTIRKQTKLYGRKENIANFAILVDKEILFTKQSLKKYRFSKERQYKPFKLLYPFSQTPCIFACARRG